MTDPTGEDARRHCPAAQRNGGSILTQLQRLFPASGVLLEVASGTGQHAAHCAAALPGWRWIPSDPHPRSLTSTAAWCAGLPNVATALSLDVLQDPWPGVPTPLDAIFNANMLHISPWPTCAALMQGAARHLSAAGVLILYGPFLLDGEDTAPSNLAFDADLRSRDARWGIRRLTDVQQQAAAVGLALTEQVLMPANNLLLVFCRCGVQAP